MNLKGKFKDTITGGTATAYGHIAARKLIEIYLGRRLKNYELVHEDPFNNNLNNLVVVDRKTHQLIHARRRRGHMADIVVPAKHEAKVKAVTLKVSTGKGDDKNEQDFQAELPASIGDAVALLGEKAVFRRFINAHVVYLQGVERSKLQKESETEPRERKRAQYLESLGL